MRGTKTSRLLIAMIVPLVLVLLAGQAHGKGGGGVSSLYKITKYSRTVSGHRWRYVLVDKDATKRDVDKIYHHLRSRYPNDYFELFNDMDTLVGVYDHSMKRGKFPDTSGHLGMINQMGFEQEWRFTSMSGYSNLEE